jgi:hypothetical protein
MTGRVKTGGSPADLDQLMRAIESAVTDLGETVSRLHDRVVAAEERWNGSADRFEALMRDVLKARQSADAPSSDR